MASTRSGIRYLYREATKASKLLVISRVANEKVLPWMVSSLGAVRCFDTVSLSQKLSLHRHALRPIVIHVLMWERPSSSAVARYKFTTRSSVPPPRPPPPPPPVAELSESLAFGDASEMRLERDTAGSMSFRFHDFSLPSNWV